MLDLIGKQLAWTRGDGPEAEIALTTRIRLARNLRALPFPSSAESSELKEVMERVSRAVTHVDREKSLSVAPLSGTTRLDRQVLAERHLASVAHLADIENRALILSQTGTISLMVNEEDHLRMQVILSGLCPEPAWKILDRLETLLGEEIEFAFSERFGYLTSCLTNVGTGLRVSVMAHLPALSISERLRNVLKAAVTLGTTVRGVFGEGSASAGNLYQISNSITIGLSEKEIIHRVLATANHLVSEERETRKQLLRERRVEIEDRVHRAFGVLTHCRRISTVEATSLLSDVRLGVDLKLIPEIGAPILNDLLLSVRPGWLQLIAGHSLDPGQRDIRRAQMIREGLAPAARGGGDWT